MRQRTSIDEDKHAVSLRRSPRFLPKEHQDFEHPVTPEIEPREIRVRNANCTPLSSNRKVSLNKNQREASGRKPEKSANSSTGPRRSFRLISRIECSQEVSKKTNVKTNGSLISPNSWPRSRRSSRVNIQVDDFTPLRRSKRLAENGSFEKRLVEKVYREIVLACPAPTNSDKTHDSIEIKSKARVNSSNKPVVKPEKRATRSSCQSQVEEGKAKHGGNIGKSSTTNFATEGGENHEERIDLGEKQRVVKRKRAQEEDGHVITKGWTKEQEVALQRAYFSAKATPLFWKKVSKMVPGKSAQECFDRIHLDHMTPPQPRPRSRAKKAGLLLSPPSASKLLQPADANMKKLRCSKLKSHFSQKAVRQILEKQYNIDRDKEADLFSVLESTTDQSSETLQEAANIVTPEVKLKRLSFLGRCSERSSSGHKDHKDHPSRFSNLSGGTRTLFSPPVLKPIKNKALHDRYIDQLHCREAKRKAASSKTATGKNDQKGTQDQQVNALQAAKNALIFDARDAINQFQNLQSNPSSIFHDEEDGGCDYSNDDDDVDEE